MKQNKFFLPIIILLLLSQVFAQSGTSKNTITISGELYDANGKAAIGAHQFVVGIYDAQGTLANNLFEEKHDFVVNDDGSYTIILGAGYDPSTLVATNGIPLTAFTGDTWFIGLKVDTRLST